jgi:tripartite-type tricarboxylate transporter receptor subunit TctC
MFKILLTTMLMVWTVTSYAKEVITIVYGWQASDAAAAYTRNMANEATAMQDRYVFLFDPKPGAGGSIAANYVQNNPNTILATTSAFWVRPQFFPKESHDPTKFRELMPQCISPLGIYSKKYQSWKQVPVDRPVTISVTGLGITSHLIATTVAKKYTQLQIIPYKSATEATTAVLSGVTDLAVSFMGDGDQYVRATDTKNQLYLLGITGKNAVDGFSTLSSQGFSPDLAEMSAPSHLVVPVGFPENKFQEIRAILLSASQKKSVLDAFKLDRCSPFNQMPDDEIQPWFHAQSARWKRATAGVELK